MTSQPAFECADSAFFVFNTVVFLFFSFAFRPNALSFFSKKSVAGLGNEMLGRRNILGHEKVLSIGPKNDVTHCACVRKARLAQARGTSEGIVPERKPASVSRFLSSALAGVSCFLSGIVTGVLAGFLFFSCRVPTSTIAHQPQHTTSHEKADDGEVALPCALCNSLLRLLRTLCPLWKQRCSRHVELVGGSALWVELR